MSQARTSGQDVLTLAPKPRTSQAILVEVNSRDRASTQTANSFRFVFQRPLKEIQTVELLSGTIPVPYSLTQANNTFTFLEGTVKTSVTVPAGFYTPTTLASALATALNGIVGKVNTYTTALDSTSTYLTVSRSAGTASFSFLFASGSPPDTTDVNTPSAALGFPSADIPSVNGVIKAPYPMDTLLTRVYLYIDFESTLSLNAVERGAGRRSPFGIIYFDQTTGGYKFLNKETVQPNYHLAQPLPRLQSLQIDFRDEFYRPVHFGGREVTLLLQCIGLVA